MFSSRRQFHPFLAVVAVLVTAVLAVAAPAPDEKELRKQALKLNDVTGETPIKGQIQALVEDSDATKKMLTVAQEMAKEKEQPFNYNACYILATAAYRLREYNPSEAFYRLAAKQALDLKSGKKLSESYVGLINVLYLNKKFDESEKVCRDFLELAGDPTVENSQGYVLRRMIEAMGKQKKFEEANGLVDKLLKLQPDNWLTLELKAELLHEQEKNEEAAKTYEEVLTKIAKDDKLEDKDKTELGHEIRYIAANVYLDLNKLDKFTEHFETLLKEDPDNATYNNDLGFVWADHDMNLEKAEVLIRKALELDRKQRKEEKVKPEEDRDNAAYLDSLGWVLFKQKKYKEALEPMLEAVKVKEGQHVEILDHLGEIHMALGEKDKALAAWKKGVEVAGDSKREKERKAAVEKKIKANE
jgi:tetratricopeptide (TPR) repeat protein